MFKWDWKCFPATIILFVRSELRAMIIYSVVLWGKIVKFVLMNKNPSRLYFLLSKNILIAPDITRSSFSSSLEVTSDAQVDAVKDESVVVNQFNIQHTNAPFFCLFSCLNPFFIFLLLDFAQFMRIISWLAEAISGSLRWLPGNCSEPRNSPTPNPPFKTFFFFTLQFLRNIYYYYEI